jgi:hypothetical protein
MDVYSDALIAWDLFRLWDPFRLWDHVRDQGAGSLQEGMTVGPRELFFLSIFFLILPYVVIQCYTMREYFFRKGSSNRWSFLQVLPSSSKFLKVSDRPSSAGWAAVRRSLSSYQSQRCFLTCCSPLWNTLIAHLATLRMVGAVLGAAMGAVLGAAVGTAWHAVVGATLGAVLGAMVLGVIVLDVVVASCQSFSDCLPESMQASSIEASKRITVLTPRAPVCRNFFQGT